MNRSDVEALLTREVERALPTDDRGQFATKEDLERLVTRFEARIEAVRGSIRLLTQAVTALTARVERITDRLELKGLI
jgi:hypothetical protein